jgi:hypothetical protein
VGLPALRISGAQIRPAKATEASADVTATLTDTAGQVISLVHADLSCSPLAWSMTVHGAERPGALTRHYFGAGARDIRVELPDGRSGAGHITRTSFRAGKRVYQIEGKGVLTSALRFLREAS